MIRFLQNSFILVSILLSTTSLVNAQNEFQENTDSRTPQHILDSYGGLKHAVLQMTREEWVVVREWEGFDENAYLDALHNFKDSFDGEREKRKELRMKMVQQNDDCGCWVEPDETYQTLVPPPGLGGLGPNEVQWATQGGAGWDVDCASPPIEFPGWTFELYGSVYSEFYVNSKGMISFGGDVIDWTPTSFPEAEYNQIAGYWQDTDNRSVGEIMYKVTQDAVYVNYVDVGYYNNHNDLTNNYQIIITPNDGIIGDGNNAQVCYLDMNWAHGDIGGGGGCCGPDPGVTGADQNTTGSDGPHVQFGRFNLLDDTYNGPYGVGEGFDDGINWLDYKYFDINTALASNNLPPVATENLGCDTITICLGQTTSVDVNFLGPEPGQSVTLDVIQNLIPGNTIDGYTQTNGTNAGITGTFVGNEPGINTIEITAVDDGSPSSQTSVTMYIEVLDILPPELTVEGLMSICAGSETTITATGDFDDFIWNVNSQFTDFNVANIPFGGTFVVTGILDAGCQVQTSFFIDQSPYYLPDVEYTPDPPYICDDDSAFVQVVPDVDEVFIGYEWEADWNGLGGEVYDVTADESGAWLAAGMYRLLVEDEAGCFGQRVFQVNNIGADIPDMTIPPMCTGLDTLEFAGGYEGTEEGDFNIYLITSNNDGWEGSFVNIIVNGEVVSTLTLINSTFDTFSVPIAFGDTIEVEYISADVNADAFNQIQVYNCSNSQNNTNISDLSSGVVYSAPAMCEVEEANGYWEETQGPGTSWFEYTDQYNSLWAPTEFGMYELCFYEENCNIPYCYEVEVTLPPTISLNETDVVLCDGAEVELVADTTDAGGTAEINWPYPGDDDILENDYTYSQYTNTTLTVEIENGCGTDEATVEVEAFFPPLIDSMFLCDEGDEIEIDPIAGDQNDETSTYEWTFNGETIPGETGQELTVSETGSYCVIVTNTCYPDGNINCGFVDIVSQIENIFEDEEGGIFADCNGDGITTINLSLPNDEYEAIWPDGSEGFSWTVPQATDEDGNPLFDENGDPLWAYNGEDICVEVLDPYGCGITEHCIQLYIGLPPTIEPTVDEIPYPYLDEDGNPESDQTVVMCDNVYYDFDLNEIQPGPPYADFTWWIECGDENFYYGDGGSGFQSFINDVFPEDCGHYFDLIALTETPCGAASEEFHIHTNPGPGDVCGIELPNVLTPRNGDDANNALLIDGLSNYLQTSGEYIILRVFDRWGNQVFEDQSYENDDPWYGTNDRGNQLSDGSYYYTVYISLLDEEHSSTITIFTHQN